MAQPDTDRTSNRHRKTMHHDTTRLAIDFNEEDSNTSSNPAFVQVLETRLNRRSLFKGAGMAGAALGATALTGCATTGQAGSTVQQLGF
ncbi:MAG: hypothetical protein Q8Q84_28145, partial [Hydrogenophaga sp.]|nr:hypothetical protein [Hydrogenophaga sp.]